MMDDTTLDEKIDGVFDGLVSHTETKALLKARLQALLVEARKKVWLELKRGDGLYTNESGCREVHVDYINERLAALDTPATQIGGEES